MCGRYYIDDETAKEIAELVQIAEDKLYPAATTKEIFPSQKAAVLHRKSDSLSASAMKWGFPRPGGKGLLINARAETLLERPAFKDSALTRRCLIPARGFYEWNANKEKAAFTSKEHSVIYMAGVYKIVQEDLVFTIITTKANASVLPIHSRMPLVVENNELEHWIFDPQYTSYVLSKTPPLLHVCYQYQQQSLFD